MNFIIKIEQGQPYLGKNCTCKSRRGVGSPTWPDERHYAASPSPTKVTRQFDLIFQVEAAADLHGLIPVLHGDRRTRCGRRRPDRQLPNRRQRSRRDGSEPLQPRDPQIPESEA